MDNDDNYVAILLEDMNDKIDVVVEAVGQLQDNFKTLATKNDLARVETKVNTIEKAVTATNQDIVNLDRRVVTLEKNS